MKTLIIGGGLTGLACAYQLKKFNKDFLIVEKENTLGGLCRSIKKDDFIFDYTGHFLHFSDSNIKSFVFRILKGKILSINRNSKVYTEYTNTKTHLIPFPFQANIGYLNSKYRRYCIETLIKSNFEKSKSSKNFYDWCESNFGKGITNLFFSPYNSKLFQTKIKDISTNWVKKFVPRPNIEEILYNVLFASTKTYGYNSKFYYPKYGGIQSLIDSISSNIEYKNILLNTEVKKIDLQNKYAVLSNEQSVKYNFLVSTTPLIDLVEIANCPEKIKLLSKKLKYVSVLCFNIALKRKVLPSIHWIYFPTKNTTFYRVGLYHNVSENLVAKNYGSIYVEISIPPKNKIDLENLKEKITIELKNTKIITSEKDILFYNFVKIPVGYVIYDNNREKIVNEIINYFNKNNIYPVGRYGSWKYSFMEENIKDGFSVAEKIAR